MNYKICLTVILTALTTTLPFFPLMANELAPPAPSVEYDNEANLFPGYRRITVPVLSTPEEIGKHVVMADASFNNVHKVTIALY